MNSLPTANEMRFSSNVFRLERPARQHFLSFSRRVYVQTRFPSHTKIRASEVALVACRPRTIFFAIIFEQPLHRFEQIVQLRDKSAIIQVHIHQSLKCAVDASCPSNIRHSAKMEFMKTGPGRSPLDGPPTSHAVQRLSDNAR